MRLHEKLRQQLTSSVVLASIGGWGSQAISFIVYLLFARLLLPDDFGLFALTLVIINFGRMWHSGFVAWIIKKSDLSDEQINTAFWTLLVITFAMYLLIFLGSPWIGVVFNSEHLVSPIRWLCPVIIIGSIGLIPHSLIQKNLQYRSLAEISIISAIISGAVGITMALRGWGIWSLVAWEFTGSIVGMLLAFRYTHWYPKIYFSREYFSEMLPFCFYVSGEGIVSFFDRRIAYLVIGFFLGTTSLGYFVLGNQLVSRVIIILSSPFQNIAFPFFSKLQNQQETLQRVYYKITHYTCLITFPLFCVIWFTAPEIARLFLGEKWLPSVPIIQIFCIFGAFNSLGSYPRLVLLAKGKAMWLFALALSGIVLNLCAILLTVQWGIVGVAIGVTLVGAFLSLIMALLSQSLIKENLYSYLAQLWVPFFGTVISAFVLYIVIYLSHDMASAPLILALITFFWLISYITFIRLASPSILHELLQIKNRGMSAFFLKNK